MSENLSQMLEEVDLHSSNIPTSTDLPQELEQEVEPPTEQPVAATTQTTPQQPTNFEYSTISFPDWFAQNHQNFDNVGHVRLSIQRVRPERNFIFKIPDPKGGLLEDGSEEMILCLFMDAHKIPVLNIPGSSINVFHNSTFQIIHNVGSGKFLKCYGVKTGLIIIFCVNINDKLIPYSSHKLKRKEAGINMIEPNLTRIGAKLTQNVDRETMLLRYNQVNKNIDELTTVQSAIDWLLERTETILDVNHLIQIDKVIISLIS